MKSIVLKYIRLILFVLLIGNIKSDSILLNGPFDGLINRAGCMAECMHTNSTVILLDCNEKCNIANERVPLKYIQSNASIRLICREVNLLMVAIEDKSDLTSTNDDTKLIYLINVYKNSEVPIAYISTSSIVKIDNLDRNTEYRVIASIFDGHSQYQNVSQTESFKTLNNDDYVPDTLSNDSIKLNYDIHNDSGELMTTIKWEPSEDRICNYYIHLYETRDDNDMTPYNVQKVKPFQLYDLTRDGLKFETEYSLEIHGSNAQYPSIKGERCTYEFTTPTCWQFHGFNLEKCRPPPVTNIATSYDIIDADSYQITITWDMPENPPEFYHVTLNSFSNKGNSISQNVSGTSNTAYFAEVHMIDVKYDVLIVAFSKGGKTTNDIIEFALKADNFDPGKHILKKLFYALLSFFMLIVVLSAYIYFQNRRDLLKYKHEHLHMDVDAHLRQIIGSYKNDEIEIDPNAVDLYEVIGEGAFGIVRKGLLKSTNKTIAVKMLKENAGIDDIKGFLSEINLMKSVGHHDNIVGIVGHSTVDYNQMMLLTEYCCEGNLLDYLRKFRGAFNLPDAFHSSSPIDFVQNPTYDLIPSCDDNPCVDSRMCDELNETIKSADQSILNEEFSSLTTRDLLIFAKQISTAMEYLVNKKIVHRDLAARNVLVCSDKTVKISDFGLSRDIYVDNIYMKSGAGRLPMKWLALESITDQMYTSQSDVWSYGILLYEIITLGCTPYPAIPAAILVDHLSKGYRMSRPHNCSCEFYQLMIDCWHRHPCDRPTFHEIGNQIDWFIKEFDTDGVLFMDKLESFRK